MLAGGVNVASPTIRVFVSSTWPDLRPEREAVEAALRHLRETEFAGMEYSGHGDEASGRASLDEVDRSHLYLCVIGGRYGFGVTEAEDRRRAGARPALPHLLQR